MKWVIQNNIYEEEGYARLMTALERRGCDVVHVKVVPFVGELEPIDGELPEDGAEAIVMGSYTLSRVAQQRGWHPGSFLSNLDFRVQLEHWGTKMLNHDAKIYTFDSVPFQEQPFFMRPVHDTKAFTGLVLDWGQYTQWVDGILRCPELVDPVYDPLGVNLLTTGTPVMVCSKKEIYSETRFWVVGGRIATSSGYKVGTLKSYKEPWFTDHRTVDFVNDLLWRPNEAHVLDIADTPDGYKIIEVNNLNSAGFYRGDMDRLVDYLERWVRSDFTLV